MRQLAARSNVSVLPFHAKRQSALNQSAIGAENLLRATIFNGQQLNRGWHVYRSELHLQSRAEKLGN